MRYNLCVAAAAGMAARREQIKGRQETSEPYQIQGEPGGGPAPTRHGRGRGHDHDSRRHELRADIRSAHWRRKELAVAGAAAKGGDLTDH